MFLTSLFVMLEDFLFIPKCLFCKREGSIICPFHASFKPFKGPDYALGLRVFVSASYTDLRVKKAVEHFKYRGKRSLAKIMAKCMSECIVETHSHVFLEKENTLLIPIPLHWTRLFWRGYNQAFLLTKEISVLHNLSFSTDLRRTKKTAQQACLSKGGRVKNVENIFSWEGPSLKGKAIYLVDDICTTGATLKSAAEVLHKAGAKEVFGVVFGRGVY